MLINLCLFNVNPFCWLLLINPQMCSAFCYLNKTPSLVPQAYYSLHCLPSQFSLSTVPLQASPDVTFSGVTTCLHPPQALCRMTVSIITASEKFSLPQASGNPHTLGFFPQTPKDSYCWVVRMGKRSPKWRRLKGKEGESPQNQSKGRSKGWRKHVR